MAFGDPMVLATVYYRSFAAPVSQDSLLDNGPFEEWANVAAISDGWSYSMGSAIPTFSRQTGTRTTGLGNYFQRLAYSAPSVSALGSVIQVIPFRGDASLGGVGHEGRVFTFTVYARNGGSGTCKIRLAVEERTAASTFIAWTAGAQSTLTGTWTQYTVTHTITAAQSIGELKVHVELELTAAGSPTVELDEAILSQSYTFSVNAAMPDEPRLIQPGRSFQRSPGGNLIVHRSGEVTCNKYEYTLHFGLVGLTQLKALRSLWLLDATMQWQPFLPHLPSYVYCRFTGEFNLRMRTPSVNSNNYHGTLTLAEI